jgi:hypothetical protein
MFENRLDAQVFIEFVLSFFCLLLFIALTTIVFVWFSNHLVDRHVKYEETRVPAGNITTSSANVNFYNQSNSTLSIFGGS